MLTGRGGESELGPALVKCWYQLLLFIVYWYVFCLFHRSSVVTLCRNLFNSKLKNNQPSLRFDKELC